jgi:hypothetical protein
LQQEAEELIRRAKSSSGSTAVIADAGSASGAAVNGSDKQASEPKTNTVTETDGLSESKHDKAFEAKKTEKKDARKSLPEPVVEKKLTVELKSVKEKSSTPTIRERIEEQKKREEERLRKLQEEKDKIKNLEKAVEEKLNAVRNTDLDTKQPEGKEILDKSPEVAPDKKERSPRRINGVEIIDNAFTTAKNGTAATLVEESADTLAQMPRWKREKLLRENRSKSTGESPPSGSGNSSPSTAAARKTSLGSPAASTLSLSPSSGPVSSPAPESDPDFARLPRWKREKILRERRQSQDQQILPPVLAETSVRENNDAEKSSLLSPSSESVPSQPNFVSNGGTGEEESNVLDESKLPVTSPINLVEPGTDLKDLDPSATSPQNSPKVETAVAAPEPVKRRRNRRPGSEEVEDVMAAGQVSRPARKSRIEDSLAEVKPTFWHLAVL